MLENLERIDKLTSVRQQIAQRGASEKTKKEVVTELGLGLDPSDVNDELLVSLADEALAQLRKSLSAIKADVEASAGECVGG